MYNFINDEPKKVKEKQIDVKRIKELARWVKKIQESEDTDIDVILELMFSDLVEREEVRKRILLNNQIRESATRYISETQEVKYWIMTKSTTKIGRHDFKEKGWNKSREAIDSFFETLGFKSEKERTPFYNEKGALELVLLPLSDGEIEDNVYENYNKLLQAKNQVNSIVRKKECSYSQIIELCNYLYSIARASINDRMWTKRLIQNKVMDFYYNNVISHEDLVKETIAKMAIVVDHKVRSNDIDDNKNELQKYRNGVNLISFLLEIQDNFPNAFDLFMEDYMIAIDYFMTEMLIMWKKALENSIEGRMLNIKILEEMLFKSESE